jgi:hypothetical protein
MNLWFPYNVGNFQTEKILASKEGVTFSAEVKNTWSEAFVPWRLIKHGDNVIFGLLMPLGG